MTQVAWYLLGFLIRGLAWTERGVVGVVRNTFRMRTSLRVSVAVQAHVQTACVRVELLSSFVG